MSLLVPNASEGTMLANFLNKTAPQDLRLKLFKNDKTPAETDVAADYTVADFTGYANIDFVAATWTVTPGAPSEAAYPQQSFTSSADQAAQLIYGYFVIQVTSGLLMWAERFTNGPYTIANNGDIIKVTPKITLE